MWGGCEDPGIIRGAFDVGLWLLPLPSYPLSNAATVAISDLQGQTGPVQGKNSEPEIDSTRFIKQQSKTNCPERDSH